MTLPSFQLAFARNSADVSTNFDESSEDDAIKMKFTPDSLYKEDNSLNIFAYSEDFFPDTPESMNSWLTSPASPISSSSSSSPPPPYLLPPTPPATPPGSDQANPYACAECPNVYKSKSKLEEHIRYRHSCARPHACPHCPKVFKSPSNLRQHVRCTHERPRYPCHQCNNSQKTFSESGLRYHRLTWHGGEANKAHVCGICGKAFAQSTLLRKHASSAHSGERRFACPYCPAAFKRKDHVDRHVTDTHSLVAELFECDVCGGRFQSASRLKQHIKLHSDDSGVRQPCPVCGKTMLSKNLVTHLNRAHQCDKRTLDMMRSKKRTMMKLPETVSVLDQFVTALLSGTTTNQE